MSKALSPEYLWSRCQWSFTPQGYTEGGVGMGRQRGVRIRGDGKGLSKWRWERSRRKSWMREKRETNKAKIVTSREVRVAMSTIWKCHSRVFHLHYQFVVDSETSEQQKKKLFFWVCTGHSSQQPYTIWMQAAFEALFVVFPERTWRANCTGESHFGCVMDHMTILTPEIKQHSYVSIFENLSVPIYIKRQIQSSQM